MFSFSFLYTNRYFTVINCYFLFFGKVALYFFLIYALMIHNLFIVLRQVEQTYPATPFIIIALSICTAIWHVVTYSCWNRRRVYFPLIKTLTYCKQRLICNLSLIRDSKFFTSNKITVIILICIKFYFVSITVILFNQN